ncbi:MAG: UbiA family prenyltransferase [Dokdonella sp.]|uniref:UbiA family prenyltransferase n=1 Tax=Dokdonella sp. TaxID=2291710 RepID=UPI00326575D6
MQKPDGPLCVDLDGTLIRTDMLLESLLALARRNPFYLLCCVAWLMRGRAHLKRQVAVRVDLDLATLPLDARVVAWLGDRSDGRRRVLCTASDQRWADALAAHVGGFDEALGSDGVRNLGGRGKADALCERYGVRGFDYAGNAATDLPVWRNARHAIVVNASSRVLARARREPDVVIERVFEREGGGWRAWIAALRPHQWSKNLLVLVPVFTAHRMFVPAAASSALRAFTAFCLCASAAYVLNDLFDLDADRRHPRKRLRPFACGRLSIGAGLVAVPLLTAAAFAIAMTLPLRFGIVLLVYAVTTLAYSLVIKRVAMLDVVALAALYTLRIVAGAVAIPVALSGWLLAFSMALFLSLALVKRYSEVRRVAETDETRIAGRGYRVRDLSLLHSLGIASGVLSVLVFAFYIDSTASAALYRHQNALWLLLPLFFYWIDRVWRTAKRGDMHDDPVVFALTDTVSLGVFGVFAAVVLLAI